MEFPEFIDRIDYLDRLQNALKRDKPQFIVIYGRRRIGKSTLIKEIIDWKNNDVISFPIKLMRRINACCLQRQ